MYDWLCGSIRKKMKLSIAKTRGKWVNLRENERFEVSKLIFSTFFQKGIDKSDFAWYNRQA